MIHSWLLVFNNISGICYIRISKNNKKFKESKVYKYAGILKLFLYVCFVISLNVIKGFRGRLVKKETIQLTKYSEFSKIILGTAVVCFYIGGFVISFTQFSRRNQTIKLFNMTNSSDLLISLKKRMKLYRWKGRN